MTVRSVTMHADSLR